jgi:hypothetical protein
LAPKIQPAGTIDDDKEIADAATILRKIERGLQDIETEIDSLNIEDYLGAQSPSNKPRRAAKIGRDFDLEPTVTRNDHLRDRLKKNRAAVPAKSVQGPLSGDIHADVAVALELIDGARPLAPLLEDRRALRDQLKRNRDAIRKGFDKQKAVVDALRDQWVLTRSLGIQHRWKERDLKIFRAMQAVAALYDEKNDDRTAEFDAGCRPWRADLLPEFMSRALLTIGSERDWDSEISRARRRLEELHIL